MKSVDLGFGVDDPNLWKERIAARLGIEFELRYSDHLGGGYWNHKRDGVEILLVENVLDSDGDLVIVGRPDLTTLVTTSNLAADDLEALTGLGGEVVGTLTF